MWNRVAKVSEIPEGKGCVLQCAGAVLALFKLGGQVYALDNACLHRGGPLGEGVLDGGCVTCPWHAWDFDVRTGECKTSPGSSQKTYPVKVDQDDIYVEF